MDLLLSTFVHSNPSAVLVVVQASRREVCIEELLLRIKFAENLFVFQLNLAAYSKQSVTPNQMEMDVEIEHDN